MGITSLYRKVTKKECELMNLLEQLSVKASEIYGEELEASFCVDGEIEFRKPGEVFYVEVSIEELAEMEKRK